MSMFEEFFAMLLRSPILFLFVVVVLISIGRAMKARQGRFMHGTRLCQNCGASLPGFAQYCRRCGQRL